jgi:D-3-phosphoglycerate dehydrogenase
MLAPTPLRSAIVNTTIVIPDDYQQASAALAFLHNTPGFDCPALGDLTRDPRADALLATAQGLILIRERTRIDQAFLRRTPALKLISQTGKIASHIDMEACTRAGVAVVEGSGSPVAPAELTWLLIMASRRKLLESVGSLRAGLWQTDIGCAVAGQTLGILGYGKIGKRLARYARAFDMQVQVWGSERAQQEARSEGLMVAQSREALFAGSDVVSVHLRLVEATRGCISLDDLCAMKADALFVNTSRAELVQSGALLAALSQGHPGFAALDVFEQEPVYQPDHPLLTLPNVLCTPHMGYVEQGGYALYFGTAFDNARRFFAGDHRQVLNPAALG